MEDGFKDIIDLTQLQIGKTYYRLVYEIFVFFLLATNL